MRVVLFCVLWWVVWVVQYYVEPPTPSSSRDEEHKFSEAFALIGGGAAQRSATATATATASGAGAGAQAPASATKQPRPHSGRRIATANAGGAQHFDAPDRESTAYGGGGGYPSHAHGYGLPPASAPAPLPLAPNSAPRRRCAAHPLTQSLICDSALLPLPLIASFVFVM